MKLPPIYRILLRFLLAGLVVLLTFSWAINNPRKIDQLRGILAPRFSSNSKGWVLEVNQLFTLCHHSVIKFYQFRTEALLKAELGRHPDYYPLPSPKGQVYQTKQKDYCPSCRDNRFIGLHQGDVVVYRGIPSKPGPIEERLPVKLKLLPEVEINDLKNGIPFRDPREKLQLIEGLNGIITE